MKLKSVLWLATLGYLFLTATAWASSDDLLSLENKYIKVFLNNSVEETGRFGVDTTGGDPTRTDDKNKPLLYGHPKPWTSFTTLQIDGTNYVFGKATTKRSGAGLPGGEIIQAPAISNNQITMTCKYGAVEAEQILDIARSPSTGALDTARIKYVISNTGATPVEVGIRALLDTMLGDNDGAPFRIGDKTIATDYSCSGNECPDYWQAFDSLAKPAVIAQCTLRGEDVTTPDRMVFTNWGKAADSPWDIKVQPGADFTRLGEDELDSAVAMYWNSRALKPGEQFTITIYYGLGGITFAPGKTYLGITAPAEVQYSSNDPRSYTIMLYLEHRGEAKAENVQINLSLPEGLECSSGKTKVTLPELIPNDIKQFSWEIRPNGLYQGDTSFQIKVSGEHLEPNTVSREIKIIGPPQLAATMIYPALKVKDNNWDPYPVVVSLKIKNTGEAATYNLKANFDSEAGLKLAPGERNEKYLLNLASNEETSVSWQVIPTGDLTTGSYKVVITGTGIKPITVNGKMEIPLLPLKLLFNGPDKWVVGKVVNLDLYAYNLSNVSKFSANVKFDPKQLRLVYLSRGTFLVEDEGIDQWNRGIIDNQNGLINNISGVRIKPFNGNEITLFRLNFIVIGNGDGQVELDNLQLFDSSGKELAGSYIPMKYQIEEEKN